MSIVEKIGLAAVNRMDPEAGHRLAIKSLNMGLVGGNGPYTSPRLRSTLAGLDLPNPIGLAAGFDKNAQAVAPLLKTGFGFIEVGAATPLPQDGNPKPRLFRLTEDCASINRFGFNNEGMQVIANRLSQRPDTGIVGLNLGANKTSSHRAIDYVKVLETCGAYVDFATINVSSPNTEKLRDLQGRSALSALVAGVMETRDLLDVKIPIFLKVAPDLTLPDIEDISYVARMMRIDAVIATNTTVTRDGLQSAHAHETGGLSGAPLFEMSTRVLAQFSELLGTDVPLIGVGGIATAKQAYAKIKAGASAVQLYTALVYGGFSLVNKIAQGLDDLLEQDGFEHISEAIGIEKDTYL
ncbi:MAG: quinone-dependent dihydroorotate dehydrogenase [Amylibacter sp.]|nr:quinone-dependent dihydroorotate dehydrogenase [Amylibacter sp.]